MPPIEYSCPSRPVRGWPRAASAGQIGLAKLVAAGDTAHMRQIPEWMRPWFAVMSLLIVGAVIASWAISDEPWWMLWLPLLVGGAILG